MLKLPGIAILHRSTKGLFKSQYIHPYTINKMCSFTYIRASCSYKRKRYRLHGRIVESPKPFTLPLNIQTKLNETKQKKYIKTAKPGITAHLDRFQAQQAS